MEENQTLILILLIEKLKELLGNLIRAETTGFLGRGDKLLKSRTH